MKLQPDTNPPVKNGRRHAFTLVEMLLVLTILAILAGLILPKIAGKGLQARIDATKTQIGAIKEALEMFEVDNGDFPHGNNGLQQLVTKPSNMPNWKGPYLDTIPLDPWHNAYIYVYPGRHNPNGGFDLSSAGPDGQAGNADDIGNWQFGH